MTALVVVVSPQATAPSEAATRSQDDAATRWLATGLDEIAAHRTNPPRAARALALVSVAMLDASKSPPQHRSAAVAGAAAAVLGYLYPDRAAAFDELAEREGSPKAVERGWAIGARVVAHRRGDGADAAWDGTAPSGPGLWVSTPPAFAHPLEPLVGTWRTWNLDSGSKFRPPPPTAFGSAAYERELREVYDVARSLTTEQKRIAEAWADGAGTVTPPGHWNLIALDLIRAHDLSAVSAARVLAALNTAQADAFIACWDAKFTYWTERPVTAIQRELDPGWLPYLATPPFPSYVSGHATTSGAAAEVLAWFFPTEALQLRASAEEAAASRLYGGIHFRSDNEAGLELGRKIARTAIRLHR